MSSERNALCSCGSGKKYKKCCLAANETADSRLRDERRAVETAIAWLHATYPDEVQAAVFYDYFGERTDEELAEIETFDAGLSQAVNINIGEWLLADAELELKSKTVRTIDLLLGKGGPLLSAYGQAWLREITSRSMSIYEVQQVMRGEGMILSDLLHPGNPPVRVFDASASRHVAIWDTFGARLAERDGTHILTGAVYPLSRELATDCIEDIKTEYRDLKSEPWLRRVMTSQIIIDYWLDSLLVKTPMPTLVDASTGEKLIYTTDYYKVLDWQALRQVLAEQDDVDTEGEEWVKIEELDDGRCRALARLTPKGKDNLEITCRTIKLADEARIWLKLIAGEFVQYKIRDMVDPRSEKAQKSAKPSPPCDIPQDVQRQIIHEHLAKHYDTWVDTPLPALGGKTPGKAAQTKRWRPQVIELLKSIEQLEQRRTAQTGGDPLDVGFLWERVGIERPSIL